MRVKYLLAFLALFTFYYQSNATHIVGGSLTYEHLGGSSYRIMLRLYRDCTNPPGNQANMQTSASIDFYYGTNGAFYQRITLPLVELVVIDPNLDSCVADPGICVQEGLFTAIVNNLPPISGGYHMYFETCCRNNSIVNITAPAGDWGEGFYCKISDNTLLLSNSSPQWRNPPPVFVCLDQDMAFDHGATDADGDSLVYSFYTPFSDINWTAFNANNHQVTFTAGSPNNIPTVPFIPNFSANNPLDVSGATNLTVNSNGIINGIPPNMGQYVAGIKCDEYRNGVKIGTIYRDFQFNVVVCPPPALAGIGPVNACNGTSITFDNTSTASANDFTWNFGDGSPTSTQFEPSHTYASLGTYTVTLIAQTGTPCADTATRTFTLSFSNANFNSTASTCINSPVNFTNTSTASGGSTINSWNWNFGDGTPNSTLPNPSHTFATSGTITVTLIVNSTAGCRDTVQIPINVQGLPVADVGGDIDACINNPQINLNGTITNASGGQWLNYSGTMTPNDTDPNATYDPDTSEINSGSMDLVWETTGNGLCPADVDTLHITFVPGPTVDAGPDIQVCRDTTSVPLQGAVTVAGGGIWSTTGNGSFSPVNSLTTTYTLDASDTALDSLYIYLTTTFNGNCIASTDSLLLEFYDPPQIVISNNDTACAGHYIQLVVTSSTGSGIWSTNGTGDFAPDSTMGAQYLPSTLDETNGSVILYFTTTNNGGCRMVEDSIEISIIPSPTPAFTFVEDCFNEATVFTDGSTSVGSVVAWDWDFGDGTSNQQNPSHVFTTEGTQSVTLVVTSNNGCTDTLTQNVLVHYLPVAAFNSPNPCLNGGTDFEDQSTVNASTIVSWDWSFGDGGSDVVQDPSHQYAASGSYSVTLIVESAFGCLDTVTNSTTVLPGPVAAFTYNDNTVSLFEEVTFTDLSTPVSDINSWYWDFEDGSNTTDQNPIHSWDSAGYYDVMLIVEDINGCIDTVTNEIIVFLPPFIPSGFTPNGDPTNSVLFVLGGPFSELQFDIYNNWGEIIFTSTEQATGWDGTYKSAPQPMGVYVYTVKAITLDGMEHKLAGDVTLIR